MEWIFCFKLEEWLDEYGLRCSLNFVEYLKMIYDNPLNYFPVNHQLKSVTEKSKLI